MVESANVEVLLCNKSSSLLMEQMVSAALNWRMLALPSSQGATNCHKPKESGACGRTDRDANVQDDVWLDMFW